jgi:putative phosphoesterase
MAIRVVVMSDIHGNLPALEAVVDSLPDCDAVFVAGDLCLEGPTPAQVLDRLLDLRWTLLMGNTDRDIVEPPGDASSEESQLIAWTRDRLGQRRLDELSRLPFSSRFNSDGDELLVVHANPLNMDDQLYPDMTEQQLQPYLDAANATILAFGHLHTPYERPVSGVVLVDVSSVGHPKDRDLRAAYTVFTWDGPRRSIEQVRIPYDVDRTVRLMRESGMPDPEKEIASLLKASY